MSNGTYKVSLSASPVYATIWQSALSGDTGDSIDIKALPLTNYKFVSWSDGNTNAERTVTISTSNIELKATYAKDYDNYEQNLQTSNYEYYCYIKDQLYLTNKPIAFMTVKNFDIQEDLLTNATAQVEVQEMNEDVSVGDILVLYTPKGLTLYKGVITSYEDTIIQCSQMQSFYKGNWVQIRYSTETYLEDDIKKVFDDYVAGKMNKKSLVDPLVAQRLGGITVSDVAETSGTDLPSPTSQNIMDFETWIYSLYESYGIILDFDIAYEGTNTCTIKIPHYTALTIGNNTNAITDISPVTNIEETNKLIIYSSSSGNRATWVTTTDGENKEISTVTDITKRFKVTKTKIVFSDDTIADLVKAYLPSTMYNHKLTFTLRLKNNIYKYSDFKLGMPLSIYIDGHLFDTVLTGWQITKENNKDISEIKMTCGKVRTSLTKKLLLGKI